MVVISIELFSLPQALSPQALAGKAAVAVDVLRAGTTIVTALHHGAHGIVPCVDVDQARDQARLNPDALLGGERQGVLIEGFSLSNSPQSYRPDVVRGRTIFFSTTNGTRAIDACRPAQKVFIGSFVNRTAVCRQLQESQRDVVIVCSGTDGVPTLEDTLFGGSIGDWLQQQGPVRLNSQAQAAIELWKTACRQLQRGRTLPEILCQTRGGKNLMRLGLLADIEFAGDLDRFQLVPLWDATHGMIRTDVDLPAGRR